MARRRPARRAEEKPDGAGLTDDQARAEGNLKALNGFLIKEAAERRELVRSLQKEVSSLESELELAESEILLARAELTRLEDTAARLELEKALEAEYIRAQMGERMSAMAEEMEGVRKERDDLGEKAMGLEISICHLVQEKVVVQEKLGEIERQRQVALEEKNAEIKKTSGLESQVSFLKGAALDMHNTEVVLRRNAAEWERMFKESVENEKAMAGKISELMEEKNESESKITVLYRDYCSIQSELANALKEIEEKDLTVERIVLENMGMKDENARAEAELTKLHNQVTVLMDTISGLEKSCKVQEEEISELKTQVARYKSSSEGALHERDTARKELGEEKQTGLKMNGKIKELENHAEKVASELAKTKADYAKVVGEKKEMKIQSESLNKEIVSLRAQLNEANADLGKEKQNGLVMKGKIKELEKVASELAKTKADYAEIVGEKKEMKIQSESLNKEIVSLRAQVNEANADLDKVLNMLKTTAVSVGGSNKEMGRVRARELNNSQINPHILELEAIKKGLKDREIKVEDMTREVECLKNSVVHANKRKSLLAIVSSATTLFAAISFAYAARFH